MKCVFCALVIATLFCSLSAHEDERLSLMLNGHEAMLGQLKFMTAVVTRWIPGDSLLEWSFCGGALISMNWVLTAAHCLYKKDEATIYLGISDNDQAQISYVVYKSFFILHPEFSMQTFQNDIALIQIPKTKVCGQMKFARLPHPNANNIAGHIALSMGWADLGHDGALPNRLRWAGLKIITNEECKKWHSHIIDSDLCTKANKQHGAPCMGDSVGPLLLNGELVGIASAVHGDDCERNPGLFSRISSYMPWILNVTGIDF